MSHHLTLRVSDAELEFLNRLAKQKGITRTAAARQLLLQNLALSGIREEINSLLESRLAMLEKRLAETQSEARDDLVKATKFLHEKIKEQGAKK